MKKSLSLMLYVFMCSCCLGSSRVSLNYKNDESTDALEVKSPICSPLNSEDNELTDSITTNFSQSNVTYYGIRIWPQDEEYYQKSVENRLYLVLGINDTLVVISDNPIFFGANILSIRSKGRARKVYSRYNLNFDNESSNKILCHIFIRYSYL